MEKEKQKKSLFSGLWRSSNKTDSSRKENRYKSCEDLTDTEVHNEDTVIKRRWPSMRRSKSQTIVDKAKDKSPHGQGHENGQGHGNAQGHVIPQGHENTQLTQNGDREWVDFKRPRRNVRNPRPLSSGDFSNVNWAVSAQDTSRSEFQKPVHSQSQHVGLTNANEGHITKNVDLNASKEYNDTILSYVMKLETKRNGLQYAPDPNTHYRPLGMSRTLPRASSKVPLATPETTGESDTTMDETRLSQTTPNSSRPLSTDPQSRVNSSISTGVFTRDTTDCDIQTQNPRGNPFTPKSCTNRAQVPVSLNNCHTQQTPRPQQERRALSPSNYHSQQTQRPHEGRRDFSPSDYHIQQTQRPQQERRDLSLTVHHTQQTQRPQQERRDPSPNIYHAQQIQRPQHERRDLSSRTVHILQTPCSQQEKRDLSPNTYHIQQTQRPQQANRDPSPNSHHTQQTPCPQQEKRDLSPNGYHIQQTQRPQQERRDPSPNTHHTQPMQRPQLESRENASPNNIASQYNNVPRHQPTPTVSPNVAPCQPHTSPLRIVRSPSGEPNRPTLGEPKVAVGVNERNGQKQPGINARGAPDGYGEQDVAPATPSRVSQLPNKGIYPILEEGVVARSEQLPVTNPNSTMCYSQARSGAVLHPRERDINQPRSPQRTPSDFNRSTALGYGRMAPKQPSNIHVKPEEQGLTATVSSASNHMLQPRQGNTTPVYMPHHVVPEVGKNRRVTSPAQEITVSSKPIHPETPARDIQNPDPHDNQGQQVVPGSRPEIKCSSHDENKSAKTMDNEGSNAIIGQHHATLMTGSRTNTSHKASYSQQVVTTTSTTTSAENPVINSSHSSVVSPSSSSYLSPISQTGFPPHPDWRRWSYSHHKDASTASYDSGVSQIGGQLLSLQQSSISRASTERPSEMGTTGIETDAWDSSEVSGLNSKHKPTEITSTPNNNAAAAQVSKDIPRSKSHHDLRANKKARKEAILKARCKSQTDVRSRSASPRILSAPCQSGHHSKACPVHGDNAVFEGQPHVHLPRTKSLEMMSSAKKRKKMLKAAKAHGGSLSDISKIMASPPNFRSIKETSKNLKGAKGGKGVSMAAESTFYHGATLSDQLRLAAAEGNGNKVVDYLNKGADFQPDREGRTAIHYASLNGYGHIVSLLTNAGCDIDAQDKLGYTALHRAAAQGHLEVIHALLEEGCVLDRQDDVHGNAALHEAAWNGYSHTLEVLVKNKANVHLLNKQGFSALHLAAQNGHNQSARVLLYAGCDSNLKNNYGDTALHTATRYGHAGVTRILVSAHCRLDATNKNGDTTLHIAAALKRRKIAKLLVEAGINTAIKNKQNETAADVARRKQHPDIVETIQAQPKMLKDKKKQKKKSAKAEKLMVNLPEGEEKKEKKGFFFKKKNKSKDKIKDQKNSGSSIEVKEDDEDYKPPLKAQSDASSRSSEFTSNATPQEMMRGYNPNPHAPHAPHAHHHHPAAAATGTGADGPRHQARGTNTAGLKDSKAGYLSQYVPKTGVQYYKDLAGNVKQGPIGYAPVCTCGPQIKKLEQKMEADRDNLYDHIGHTHKMITEQINKIDQRCSQQVYAIDKLTRDRLDNDRADRDQWLAQRLDKERTERDVVYDKKHKVLRNEVQFHVDTKMTAFEKKYGHDRYCEGCDWCKRSGNNINKRGTMKRNGRRHQVALDDDSINYSFHNAPMPGALVRAHSDETLSVSSSHPSRRHWKVRTKAMKDLKDKQLAQIGQRAERVENELRTSPPGAPQPVYQEIPARIQPQQLPPQQQQQVRLPTGRSPEGQADVHYTENPYGTWAGSKRAGSAGRDFEGADGKPDPIVSKLQVHDEPPVKGKTSTAAVVHQTQVLSVGAMATEANISPNSYVNFRPPSALDASTPKSNVGDSTASSIDLDSFHQYGTPQKSSSAAHHQPMRPAQPVRPADAMNSSQGYHRAIMNEWYGSQKAVVKADPRKVDQHRPVQPPPIGYGQQTRGQTFYTAMKSMQQQQQQPQPQVPSTTNNNNNNEEEDDETAFVSGKATQV